MRAEKRSRVAYVSAYNGTKVVVLAAVRLAAVAEEAATAAADVRQRRVDHVTVASARTPVGVGAFCLAFTYRANFGLCYGTIL